MPNVEPNTCGHVGVNDENSTVYVGRTCGHVQGAPKNFTP